MGELEIALHPLGSAPKYTFAVVCTLDGPRVLLSRHRDRLTWEHQGGHVEPGEAVEDAAVRELYEESGVVPAIIEPWCDYWAHDGLGSSWGRLYRATVGRHDPLPASEIAEVRWFDDLPPTVDLTYPWITIALYRAVVPQPD